MTVFHHDHLYLEKKFTLVSDCSKDIDETYFGALFGWIVLLAAKVFPSILFTQLSDPKVGGD